jgi:triosephosphate isomerase
MRRKIVAGNWKMHGSRAESATLIDAVVGGLATEAVQCVLCPPFVYLHDAWRMLRSGVVALGAQNVCAEAQGAFTGEVSAAMLKDIGCEYVLVGHSERRALYGEDNSLVARKFAAALGRGLTPVLCVGEQLAEREAGRTNEVLGAQLEAVIALCGAPSFAGAVVAYEPVWAIGTGLTPSTGDVGEMHRLIRERLGLRYGKASEAIRVLYGGSVNRANAKELLAVDNVDGALVGGASLKADEFLAIAGVYR